MKQKLKINFWVTEIKVGALFTFTTIFQCLISECEDDNPMFFLSNIITTNEKCYSKYTLNPKYFVCDN